MLVSAIAYKRSCRQGLRCRVVHRQDVRIFTNNKENEMKDMLFFDSMLTPKIITAVYWLLLLVAVFTGLATMLGGKLVAGLLTLVIGALGARIWCELLIVLFKMNEALQEMRRR